MTKTKEFFVGVKEGMKNFGKYMSTVINTILLFTVYIFGVGMTAVIAKIIGKKFLENKSTKKKSYWSKLNIGKEKREKYYRQF